MKKQFVTVITFFLSYLLFCANMTGIDNAFHFNHYKLTKDSEISAANLNQPITEKDRIIVSDDGHLQADGKRIRIFGTNLSEFPKTHEMAEFAAQALANQGYNCIRFHHTDASWSNCFLKRTDSNKWVIDYKRLDDFDYFFYQLKLNGIYSNINLLTGRSYTVEDGFPEEIRNKDWKSVHLLGIWNDSALEKQKKYAFDLLTHVNPYTNIAYKNDPAVAIVEVNNENGLLMGYLADLFEDYDSNKSIWSELENQWNTWLKTQNLDYNKLAKLYNKTSTNNKSLIDTNSKWNLEQHNGAKALISKEDDITSLKIENNGAESWHVQYSAPGLNISKEEIYTIKFQIKASAPCEINVSINQAHDPWQNAGFSQNLKLTTKWQNYEITVSNLMTDANLRLIFSNMGFLAGKTIYFKDISLFNGGDISFVTKKGNKVVLPKHKDFKSCPQEYQNLILNFLWEKEDIYWKTMNDYLKKEIGIKALTMGTAMGCSTSYLQNTFDIIDTHAYWNHPIFTENSWDMSHYYVDSKTMTKADRDNKLTDLAQYRVFGKPFSVSEYDHPYPSQFSSEMYPMIASFASFQDWDCIFTFCSELPKNANGQKQKINGYFDQSNNPSKSCASPIASRIFRNFLVSPGKTKVYVSISLEDEKNNLYKNKAWSIGTPKYFGLNEKTSMLHQIGIALNNKIPSNGITFYSLNEKYPPEVTAFNDTNEIFWDIKSGVYLVNNDDVSISIISKDSILPEISVTWKKEGRISPLSKTDDFATFASVREGKKHLIFVCSWAGNANEKLREYNQNNSSSKTVKTRDYVKLTTSSTLGAAPVYTLGIDGNFEIYGKNKHNLFQMNIEGNRESKITTGNKFILKPETQTLWYVLD